MTVESASLADTERLASAAAGGNPSNGRSQLVVRLDPPCIVWTSAAAESAFGTSDRSRIARAVFGGDAGSRGLVTRLKRLNSKGAPRLERLLLWSGFGVASLTLLCRAVDAPSLGSVIVIEITDASATTPLVDGTAAPDGFDDRGHAEAVSSKQDLRIAFQEGDLPQPALDNGSESSAPPLRRAFAEVQAAFAEQSAGRQPPRFVWQTDADGVLTRVGPELAAWVGDTAPQVGQSFSDRLTSLGSSGSMAVADALSSGRSWSGIPVPWPIAGADAAVTLVLGGAQQTTRGQGVRGFGIVRLDAVTALAPSPAPEAPLDPAAFAEDDVADDGVDLPVPPAPIEPFDGSDADGTAGLVGTADASTEPRPPSADDDLRPPPKPDDLPRANADEPNRERREGIESAEDIRSEQASVAVSTLPEAAARTANVVHLSTFKIANVQSSAPRSIPSPHKPGPDPVDVDIEAPLWSEMPEGGKQDLPLEEQQLSTNERFNFDEIARALGVRTSADTKLPSGIEPHAPPVETSRPGAAEAAALLDAVPIGIVVARAGQILYANRTLLAFSGFLGVEDLREAGGLEHLFSGQVPSGDAGLPHSVTITTKAGESIVVDARVQETAWNGEPASLLSFRRAVDAAAAARAEALRLDLKRSQSTIYELSAAVDLATAGLGFLDTGGRILSINAGAERLFGYDQKEVVGDLCTLLIAPEEHEAWTAFFKGFAAPGSARRTTAFRLFAGRKRQGDVVRLAASLRWVSADKICIVWTDHAQTGSGRGDEGGSLKSTDRGNDMKAEFLAKVSHEIRTPLNAMLGFTEIIMEERFGPVGNERYREYLRDIHSSGRHVMSLINDLLDLSRIEAGGLDLNLVPVDANVLVGECVATMQSQAHRDRIIIRTSLAPRLPSALADERALRQIMLNLLSNAVKFNEPGGQVIVSTAVGDNGRVVIRVRDTGLGMTDEDIVTAMKPFRQLATPKAGAGTGLGLPLTKALVDASRGGMVIKSRPREGTLVEISFEKAVENPISLPAE